VLLERARFLLTPVGVHRGTMMVTHTPRALAADVAIRRGAAALLVAALAVGAPSARADDGRLVLPTDATLAALIDDSLAVRPELRAAQATVDAETSRVPQAGALPDPMLEVGWQNDGFTSIELGTMEGSYVSVMASQTFPWAGKRRLRRDVAALGARQAAQAVRRWRLSTEAEVRRAYLELVLVRDRSHCSRSSSRSGSGRSAPPGRGSRLAPARSPTCCGRSSSSAASSSAASRSRSRTWSASRLSTACATTRSTSRSRPRRP